MWCDDGGGLICIGRGTVKVEGAGEATGLSAGSELCEWSVRVVALQFHCEKLALCLKLGLCR